MHGGTMTWCCRWHAKRAGHLDLECAGCLLGNLSLQVTILHNCGQVHDGRRLRVRYAKVKQNQGDTYA